MEQGNPGPPPSVTQHPPNKTQSPLDSSGSHRVEGHLNRNSEFGMSSQNQGKEVGGGWVGNIKTELGELGDWGEA